jgi:hypothetical protein
MLPVLVMYSCVIIVLSMHTLDIHLSYTHRVSQHQLLHCQGLKLLPADVLLFLKCCSTQHRRCNFLPAAWQLARCNRKGACGEVWGSVCRLLNQRYCSWEGEQEIPPCSHIFEDAGMIPHTYLKVQVLFRTHAPVAERSTQLKHPQNSSSG